MQEEKTSLLFKCPFQHKTLSLSSNMQETSRSLRTRRELSLSSTVPRFRTNTENNVMCDLTESSQTPSFPAS